MSEKKNDEQEILELISDKPVEKVEKVKKNEEKVEYRKGCGIDIGTANIVVSRQTVDGKFVNRYHRNMLYPLDVSEEATDLLEKSNYLNVKVGNKYYIVGEDSLNLVNAIGRGSVIRPMANGILNPSIKESSELLFFIIKAVVGDPIVKNEPLRFSIPAASIDVDNDIVFHKMILQNFFKGAGYDAKPVNEAMAIAYDSMPISKTEGGDVPLSGVCQSCGAGMTNLAFLYKGLELSSFSITKSGDYIDEQVAKVTGIAKSKITKRKEKELVLDIDNSNDRVLSALTIYYNEYINRITRLIGQEFTKRGSEIEGETEVVVAGGTSLPCGFCKIFENSIREADFPIKIFRVRHADNPFLSVSNGCCIRAQADYQKLNKK